MDDQKSKKIVEVALVFERIKESRMRQLEECEVTAVASLPDGSHIIYASGSRDEDSFRSSWYKIVRSPIDLLKGEWQMIPTDIKDAK